MVLLIVVVHPIDTQAHPTCPSGWRWAVMVGDGALSDMGRCANAGWCPNREAATAEGDQNGATAVKALQMVGVAARYGDVVYLDHDPIPVGGDQINFA